MKDRLKRFFRSSQSLSGSSTQPSASVDHLQTKPYDTVLPQDKSSALSIPPTTDSWNEALQKLSIEDQEKVPETEIQKEDNDFQDTWRVLENEKRGNILDWISSTPYEDHHRLAKTGRTPDTGRWIFEQRNFQDWRSSKDSMIFWLHGIPGAGKTKLVSRVVDGLLDNAEEQKVVYFYCDRNEELRRKPKEIIRSFVKQLSITHDQTMIHDGLIKIYDEKRQRGFLSRGLSLEESEDLLAQLIPTYSRAILVLDALDESEESSREGLVSYFNRLVEQLCNLKIFVSSRRDENREKQLEMKVSVTIEERDNRHDIERFVKQRISEDEKFRASPIPAELQTDIVRVLLEKSRGVCKIATRALQLVLCSTNPLTADILVFFVCQDPGTETSVAPYVDVQFILDSCPNLLIMDPCHTCRLSHLSVYEHFEKHWSIGMCHGNAAKVCLTHMLGANNRQSPRYSATAESVFTYATHHWFEHIRKYECYIGNAGGNNIDPQLSLLVEKFLGSVEESGPAYRSWCTRCEQMPHIPIEDLKPFSNPMLAICRLGFHHVPLTWWQSKSIDPEQTNEASNSLLALAILSENKITTQRLLSLRADINRPLDGLLGSGSALGAAASTGNQEIIKLLLSKGAKVNQKHTGGIYGNALVASIASPNGRKATQLLLDSGAEINQELNCGIFGSALAAAATRGGPKATRLLLQAGANVNQGLTSGNYGSALAAAASTHGCQDTVKLLLSSGADVNQVLTWGHYGSALAAAACGDPGNIKLLLDAGADVNQTLVSGLYGSALAAAAYSQRYSVKSLLDAGADVNQKLTTGLYGSALATAVAKQSADKKIVQLLLDAGADVNQKLASGLYGSVLEAARARTRPELYEMLLDAGAKKSQGSVKNIASKADKYESQKE
ncbi:hypothetical protein ETB97_007562 [Aspergillus alliaceus]|uniref:Nephrocystin 3-like N-terminal domain-containing protein n=1 Tax=Petromyces alliaceus TaxID=209559 RepID=A0A8H6AB39_PETAA|nr:hypothetical protein ETB97_007562 [Aspergillus burnettii]